MKMSKQFCLNFIQIRYFFNNIATCVDRQNLSKLMFCYICLYQIIKNAINEIEGNKMK